MKIKSLHVRRFRSVESASMEECGALNVLIGKNNAGKSNLMTTIPLLLRHLRRGAIAGPWRGERFKDEYTDRITATPIQIGVEFELPTERVNDFETPWCINLVSKGWVFSS
jgi:ABC-type branched-subunit amino acid transport system ATPase component